MGGEPGQVPVPHDGAEYARLLADVRAIIAAGRGRAAAAVNQELVATYWGMCQKWDEGRCCRVLRAA
jgi:hypothetical protein